MTWAGQREWWVDGGMRSGKEKGVNEGTAKEEAGRIGVS